jgi:hypothetical protein
VRAASELLGKLMPLRELVTLEARLEVLEAALAGKGNAMPFRVVRRPASVKARLRKIEEKLDIVEPWASIESRAMLTRWLAEVDNAAELYDDYVYHRDTLGTTGVLASPDGREALLAVVESIYNDV